MKIAIYGAGPLGLEAALKFHLLGANVVVFDHLSKDERYKRGHVSLLMTLFQEEKANFELLTSSWGRRLTESSLSSESDFKGYFESYYATLLRAVAELGLLKQDQVHRVHKRFLGPKEQIDGRTRFLDLFRVISIKTPNFSEEDVKGTLIEKLGDSIVDSLESPYETFEDFDVVIDTEIETLPNPIGPSASHALNELRLGEGLIHYGADALSELNDYLKSDDIEKRNIVIVGSGLLAGLALKRIAKEKNRPRILWVSTHDNPMEDVITQVEKFTLNSDDLKNYFSELEIEWTTKKEQYQKALFDWRELEDYMKAKIKAPEEPVLGFEIRNSANITAVDRLLDQSKNYVTIESPLFRNGQEDLMETRVFDKAFVFTGHASKKLAQGLDNNEKGYFKLADEIGLEEKITQIENELLKMFSPA